MHNIPHKPHCITLVILLFLVLWVTACTGSTETPANNENAAVPATTVPATSEPKPEGDIPTTELEVEVITVGEDTAEGETRTVTDAAGNELEILAHPQRVVALSERDMDAAFALGAPVVGVVDGRGAMAPPAYLQPYLGKAVSVGAFSAPSPEAILALDPDLILIGGLFPTLEEILPDLRQIAPVYISFNSGDDWKKAFLGTADALNKTAEAEAWLANYEANAAAIAAQVTPGTTVSIVRFNPDGPVIMAPGSFASSVITEAGLTRPEGHMDIEGQGHSDPISQEALTLIDADYLFVGSLNPEGNAVLEAALNDPLYAALNVFQNEAVAVVDGAVWTTLGGPLAAQIILDQVAAAPGITIN